MASESFKRLCTNAAVPFMFFNLHPGCSTHFAVKISPDGLRGKTSARTKYPAILMGNHTG